MKRWTLAVALAAAAVVAGCSAGRTPPLPSVPNTPSSSAPSASTAPPLKGCDQRKPNTVVQSYSPSDSTDGPALQRIKRNKKLVVGVSADNLLFGYRNPIKKTLEGFDIDMVNKVAAAIFGTATGHVQYVVENFAQRIPDLQAQPRKVDMVADIMTITCARWGQIAFSTEYFSAGQEILVPRGSSETISDLNGRKATVCTATGSTGSETLKDRFTQIKPRLVDDISDCMVLFQQGGVDAIISDNTVVEGFAAQDPYGHVVNQRITDEPYGLGFNKADVDFVRFVNALLERMHADGDWQSIHDKWLPNDPTKQPQPLYGRPLP